MNYKLLGFLITCMAFASLSFAQVATVEVQGVEATAAKSGGLNALLRDGSVGETTIVIHAKDADGNPVAGAEVVWRVENRADTTVYVVGTSASMALMLERALVGQTVEVAGGVTDASGMAYIVVDSQTAGDARVYVTAGGVDGKTYRGRDMRVVWF